MKDEDKNVPMFISFSNATAPRRVEVEDGILLWDRNSDNLYRMEDRNWVRTETRELDVNKALRGIGEQTGSSGKKSKEK